MQFKVPQNIDMADRVVGSLTLIQFLYVLIGGIIVYFLFSTIAPVSPALFIATAGPVALFSLAMAFLKIQDQPFPRFVVAFIFFLFRPKMRIWHKDGIDASLIITPDKIDKKETVTRKTIKKSELDQLVTIVDTGGKIPGTTARPVRKPAVDAVKVANPKEKHG